MFEHSVKVPRHYKVAANIFKKVSTEGGSVKTLLYDDKLRHFRTNVLFALITETIKHAAAIDKIFKCSGFLEAEPRLDPWLAKVLTTEILFGKKVLPGKSKPEQTILSYKDKFQTYVVENDGDLKSKVRRPRYVRVNTNLLTTSDAIRAFQDEGYKFIRCTSGSYDDYLQQIQSLTEYDFTQDYHVKTVFVFPSGTKLHEHELYMENKIILQDKATTLAVHLLAPPPGSVVLDLCSAPGMKTTQLAAYMRNQGKIYAIERNEQRYQTLCEFVERTDSKCVQTVLKDSLEIKRGDYDDVEYILLDPSCSGSGMEFCVHNYVEDTRLAKLTSLQEKFLKHAMNSFPNVKRIVYSTCSIFPEENERVITNVVKTSRAKWRVQDVKELLKGQWNNFGSGMYGSMGTRCLYAKPDTDFTTGFFLAVLDKDQKDLGKVNCDETQNEGKSKRNKGDKICENGTNTETIAYNQNEHNAKRNNKKNKNIEKDPLQDSESILDETLSNSDGKTNEKRKIKNSKKIKNLDDGTVQLDKMSSIQDDNINEVNHGAAINSQQEDEELSTQVKKKKNNKNNNPDIKEIHSNTNLDVSISSKKSKHKKKDKTYEIEEIIDNTEISEKNKKKRKHSEILINSDDIKNVKKDDNIYPIEIEDPIDNTEPSEKLKKKKKRKHSESLINTEEIKNVKKKSKIYPNELEDTIDNAETSEKSKKKKKSNSESLINTEDNKNVQKKDKHKLNSNEIDNTEASEKSKKKKEKKLSETINNEDIGNDASVHDARKKNKKKRNKVSVET